MTQATLPTRYERVRAILDAAGNSMADYGGVGRFWRLQLPELLLLQELLEVEIYGVRMIAPAEGRPRRRRGGYPLHLRLDRRRLPAGRP